MRSARKDKIIYVVLIISATVLFWAVDRFLWPAIDSYQGGGISKDLPAYLMPESTTNDVIYHDHYALSYREADEQAEWVIYGLNSSQLTYDDRKRPFFIEDPLVVTRSADWRNYKNSGYDRGHLCPAGDRRFSESAYNETFYTSNISPMKRDFNAGVWNRLEMQVRQWAKRYDSVYVITGGILEDRLTTIGYEGVTVPKAFYKIVVKGTAEDIEALAFLFPHQETNSPLKQFLVPIDLLEEETGIDFFKALPDEIENGLEKEISSGQWRF